MDMYQLKVGDEVEFRTPTGYWLLGEVVAIGRKYTRIKSSSGKQWNILPGMAYKVK